MILTPIQTFLIICMVSIGTIITRFIPFSLFNGAKSNNSYINYLGRVLPYSAIGLLLVYCLKGVDFKGSTYGIPEIIAIICTALLHYWKENALISIGVGTAVYMVFVQVIFR